jgi:hypothetical protein
LSVILRAAFHQFSFVAVVSLFTSISLDDCHIDFILGALLQRRLELEVSIAKISSAEATISSCVFGATWVTFCGFTIGACIGCV